MMQRGLQDGKADRGMMQRGRKRAGEGDWIGVDRDAVEMMLGEPDDVDPKLVRQPRLGQGLVDNRAVRAPDRGNRETGNCRTSRGPPYRSAPSRTDGAAAVKTGGRILQWAPSGFAKLTGRRRALHRRSAGIS